MDRLEKIDYQALRKLSNNDTIDTNSIDALYRAQRQRNLGFTRKQVAYFLKGQESYQLSLEFNRPKEFSSIVAREIGSSLQADLIFFKRRWRKGERSKFAKEPSRTTNLLVFLNVVDVKSRKAWSKHLKSKNKDEVTRGFAEILDEIQAAGHQVKNLNSDSGKEFLNDKFQALLSTAFDEPIKHYISDKTDFAKNGIVERFNRTMRINCIWSNDRCERVDHSVQLTLLRLANGLSGSTGEFAPSSRR